MFNQTTLIFAPHMDDEVLGCGGILSYPGGQQHVHFLTSLHPTVQEASRIECELVADTNGHTISYDSFTTNRLHLEPIANIIATMEATIIWQLPTTVLLPYPDYNQDHRVVFEAGVTACRPHDKNHYVKNVLLYEMPCTHHGSYAQPFRPDVLLPIDIEAKIELYGLYTSQVRAHRSFDSARALAGLRGNQCNRQFAEAYQVVRVTL
jgi:LmbE family N-acetylglucosaminyl deacetylase